MTLTHTKSRRGLCVRLLPALLLAPAILHGQAIPVVTGNAPLRGFQLPSVRGTLTYGLTLSESVIHGQYGDGGTSASTAISGNLGYLSGSQLHPFSAIYSGGFLTGVAGQPNSVFQNLALSQLLKTGRWTFTASDAVSYLPQSSTGGLSGIAGLGDLNNNPVTVGVITGQGPLSYYANRVTNSVLGAVDRQISGRTTLDLNGNYQIIRFVGNNDGYNSDSLEAGGALNHRLDGRDTIGGNYAFSRSTYGGTDFSFDSQSFNFTYIRQISPRFVFNASAGPQLTTSTFSGVSTTQVNADANLGLAYTGVVYHAALGYVRGTNSGYGVLLGSRSDSITLNAGRAFNRAWGTGAYIGFNHGDSLGIPGTPGFSNSTIIAGGQVSRAITRNLSAYGSYTVSRQATQGSVAAFAYSGTTQIFGFGVTFAPAPLRLGGR